MQGSGEHGIFEDRCQLPADWVWVTYMLCAIGRFEENVRVPFSVVW